MFPSSATTKGCVWIKPSAWEWIPALATWFGLPYGFSKAGAGSSHSPQMFTSSAVCQWSPGSFAAWSTARGGPLPGAVAAAPHEEDGDDADDHDDGDGDVPAEAIRCACRFGLRYRERIAAR